MKYQKDRPCPKCGEIGAMTEYQASYDKGDLQRRCRNCGYSWTEEPLDEEAAHEDRKRLTDDALIELWIWVLAREEKDGQISSGGNLFICDKA